MDKLLKHENQIKSLLINTVVLIVLLLIACPRYESDSDLMMQTQLYGLRGEGFSSYLIFSNILLGKVLKGLMIVCPTMPWYTIYQYVCIFFSLFVIGCIFLKRNQSRTAIIIYSCFTIFAGYECYMRIGYLKTSAILCVAAAVLLYYVLTTEGRHIFLDGWIIAGVILASMISWRACLISGTLSFLCVVVSVLLKDPKKLKNVQLLAILILVLAGTLTFRILDERVYERDPAYGLVVTYRGAVEKLSGFGGADYTEEARTQLGLTKGQFNNIKKGTYTSDELEALPKLQAIANLHKSATWENFIQFFRIVPIRFIKIGFFYCFVLLWTFAMQSEDKVKRKGLGVSIGMLLVVYFILYMQNGWSKQPVSVLVLLPLCMMALFHCEDVQLENHRYALFCLAVMGMLLYMNFSDQVVTSTTDVTMESYMGENTVDVGLNVLDLNKMLRKYSVFQVYSPGLINRTDILIINGNYSILPSYPMLTCRLGMREDAIVHWMGSGSLKDKVIE